MLRARASSSASSVAAIALDELLFGQARALAASTSVLHSSMTSMTSSPSLPAAFFSSSASAASSQSSPPFPWASRGESSPSTSTSREATEGLIDLFCGGEESALILGGRRSSESLLSPSAFLASPFQVSLWQQQRRWMAVPKKKSSLHRRGMRNSGKFVRRTESIAKCSRCSALMHPMQVPHYFCEDDACPSKHGGEKAASEGASAVVAGDVGSSSGGSGVVA